MCWPSGEPHDHNAIARVALGDPDEGPPGCRTRARSLSDGGHVSGCFLFLPPKAPLFWEPQDHSAKAG
eukprot:5249019-Pyramimonas_sp.AAC.1